MKWIKSRELFLEAKIKDLINPSQRREVSSTWGEKYLEYEETEPTDNINQGKWKLSDEDKIKFLDAFFSCDIETIINFFHNLNDHFSNILSESIDLELLNENYQNIFEKFDPKNPNLDQIINTYNPIFRKLSVGETKAEEIISRDINNRPITDGDGNMVKIKKKSGDPIFSKNLVNLSSFMVEYNLCYPENTIDFYEARREMDRMVNIANNTFNSNYHIGCKIFDNDIYLSISHNPKDILNISISKFYSSCQNLYSGDYSRQLLANVFDPNTIPAFILVETPISIDDEVISDVLPLSRIMIRSLESYDVSEEPEPLYFDRVYPDRGEIKSIVHKIIEKYSGNMNSSKRSEYIWFANVRSDDDLKDIKSPYMDSLPLERGRYIGSNTKDLRISGNMEKYKISPKSKIESLMIDTIELPYNFLNMEFDLKNLKFNFLKINDLSNFSKIKTDKLYLNKCSFDLSILNNIEFNSLSLNSCGITGKLGDPTNKIKIKNLEILYSLDHDTDLRSFLDGVEFEYLVISSDLSNNNKPYLKEIKNKVTIKGPIL